MEAGARIAIVRTGGEGTSGRRGLGRCSGEPVMKSLIAILLLAIAMLQPTFAADSGTLHSPTKYLQTKLQQDDIVFLETTQRKPKIIGFLAFSTTGFRPAIPQYQHVVVTGTRSGDAMSDVRIEPWQKIFVRRATNVIWLNRSDTPILIQFGKGTNCRKLAQYFSNTLTWRSRDCHITGRPIPAGEQVRIFFEDSGGYSYEIRFVGTTNTIQGEIVVH